MVLRKEGILNELCTVRSKFVFEVNVVLKRKNVNNDVCCDCLNEAFCKVKVEIEFQNQSVYDTSLFIFRFVLDKFVWFETK